MIYWRTTKYKGYEINNIGEIRSIDRCKVRKDTGTMVTYRGKILKCQLDKVGYVRIRISIDNVKVTLKIHRLVAEAFVKNDDPVTLLQVNHKDGNKSNNTADNLEWVNNSKNQIHALETGLKKPKYGKDSPNFNRSVKVYDKHKNLVTILSGNKEMKEFGVDFRLVSACLMGKRNTHKGFTFERCDAG